MQTHTHTLTCWSSMLMPLHRSLCCVHALQIAGRNTHKTRTHPHTHMLEFCAHAPTQITLLRPCPANRREEYTQNTQTHTHTLTCWSSIHMPLHRSLCCVHALQISDVHKNNDAKKHTHTLTCWSSMLMPLPRSLCCVHAMQISDVHKNNDANKHTHTLTC